MANFLFVNRNKMKQDLTVKCRGCLAEEPEMHNLFNLLTDDLTLAVILSDTTSSQIDESKEISQYLCIKCTEIVVDFYNFKVQFAESRTYFENELQKLKESLVIQNKDTVSQLTKVEDENIEYINTDLLLERLKSDDIELSTHCSTHLPPLAPFTASYNENKRQMILEYGARTEINRQVIPEVGEFTVQNELVQLIESVVFCCRNCNKDYLLKDDFLDHMRDEHDEETVDPSKFTKKSLVKLPLGNVKEENCNSDLEDDVEDEQKLCKLCNIFVSKAEYLRHHDEHKTHICSCGAKFLRKSHLVNHEKSVHSNERHFECNYCSKAFKLKQSLTKHLRYHTHPRSEICHICGQIFNDKSVLNTHIKLKHFPTRDFQCSHCGLKFSLKSTLFRHTSRHHTTNRKKTFSCTLCNITYYDRSTLNRHLSVKHSNQPIKARCEYCDKTFTTKGNLYKHLRTYRTHKHERVIINNDGSAIVQKSVESIKASTANNGVNFVLERGVILSSGETTGDSDKNVNFSMYTSSTVANDSQYK